MALPRPLSVTELSYLLPPGFRFKVIQNRKSFEAAALWPPASSEVVARVVICTDQMPPNKQVPVVGTKLEYLLLQFLALAFPQVGVVQIVHHSDPAYVTFTDANDRHNLVRNSPYRRLGHLFFFGEHNEDANGESATYSTECWIMLLDFPNWDMSETRIKNAIAPFGALLDWRRDHLNSHRIILKTGVVNLESVPEFIFLTDQTGNQYTCWPMQCEILEEEGHNPPAPSAISVGYDNCFVNPLDNERSIFNQQGPAGPSHQNMQQNLNPGQNGSNWQRSCYGVREMTGPVQLLSDRPNVELIKRWNLLHQHMPLHSSSWQPNFNNRGLPSTRFMEKGSGSSSIPMKEVMQARPKRGVLIEPLESTDDSDEEPPLKRNLHCKYRLRFVNKVREHSGKLEPVKADDGDDLKVALFDENNTKITSGPLSSASVEVSALQGDFNAGGEDYWTSDEFSRCKEAGLQVQGGDCILQLADGEACLSGAVFHRTGKFRIGVIMASSPLHDERILEAISEPVLIYKMSTPLFKFRRAALAVSFIVKLQAKIKASHLKLEELAEKTTAPLNHTNSCGGFFVPRDIRMYETSMAMLKFRRAALVVSFIVKLQKIKASDLKLKELKGKKTVQDHEKGLKQFKLSETKLQKLKACHLKLKELMDKRTVQDDHEKGLKQFKLSEMKAVTDDFSDDRVIGIGGFFKVYKAELHDGLVVAVKKFDEARHHDSLQLFINEVTIGTKLNHKNIVKYLGYCVEQTHILVLDYVPNGSMQDTIDGNIRLEWPICLRIIQGIAQGAQYLHDQRVIHSNLNPSNILFDTHMNPVIIDFIFSAILEPGDDEIILDNFMGNAIYTAPELINSRRLSMKQDVFSFGVCLLRTILSMFTVFRQSCFFDWAFVFLVRVRWDGKLREAGGLKGLLKPTVQVDESQLMEMNRCLEVGWQCIEFNPEKRPTMAEVVEILSGEKELSMATKRRNKGGD